MNKLLALWMKIDPLWRAGIYGALFAFFVMGLVALCR